MLITIELTDPDPNMNRLPAVFLVAALLISACDSTNPEENVTAVFAKKKDTNSESVTFLDGETAAFGAAPTTLTFPNGEEVTVEPVSRYMVSTRNISSNFAATVEALGGSISFQHEPTGFVIVDGLSAEAADELAAVSGVNEIVADVTLNRAPIGSQEAVEASLAAPNDAYFYGLGYQWNMDVIGAPTAWAAGHTGSSSVTVAIIDSGLDAVNTDLVGRVDAFRSRSFLAADEFEYVIKNFFFPSYPDWADLNGHGTHVGATVSSNGILAAGITDQTTLMAVKVCRYDSSCSGAAIIAGVLYAADAGADVANMSLGGAFDKSDVASGGFPGYVGFVNRTFNYASRQGMTIVVSAGNEAEDLDHNGDTYKTYCDTPATICVSATGPQASDNIFTGPFYDVTAPASYTNFGRSAINVAAPGGDSNGVVWAACTTSQTVVSGGFIYAGNCTASPNFVSGKAGTSMAAPHVSGLAALLVQDYGRNPNRIKNRIQQTADDLGSRGTDPFYGKGHINIPAALGL